MLRRNIIGFALTGCVALATTAALVVHGLGTPATRPEPATAATATHTPGQDHSPLLVAESASCVSECQARHDRCRVQTKGSPSCDAERQRCLEVCLQKKKK